MQLLCIRTNLYRFLKISSLLQSLSYANSLAPENFGCSPRNGHLSCLTCFSDIFHVKNTWVYFPSHGRIITLLQVPNCHGGHLQTRRCGQSTPQHVLASLFPEGEPESGVIFRWNTPLPHSSYWMTVVFKVRYGYSWGYHKDILRSMIHNFAVYIPKTVFETDSSGGHTGPHPSHNIPFVT